MIVPNHAVAYLSAFVVLGTTGIASAQVEIPPTAAPEAPTCMNFSDLDFTLNGDATWSTDCRLELTSEDPMKSGSAFAAITFDDTTNYPFEAYYEYDISDTVINGTSVGGSADGIAFLVHIDPQGVNALNDAGGALGVYGAGGIHCAIVIELDTYFGPTNTGPHAPFSTDNYTRALDIIATDEAGNATRYAELDITDIFTMQGKVWVSHNNGVLDVYLATQTATSRPPRPIVSVNMPIPALLLSREEIYVGFSSSTGGEYDKHEVVFCSFEESDTPEPTISPTNKPVPRLTASPTPPITAKPSSSPSTLPSNNPTLSPTRVPQKVTKPPVVIPAKTLSPTFKPSTVPVVPPPPTSNIVPPKIVERCDDNDDESKAGKGKGSSKSDSSKGKGKGSTSDSSSYSGKGGSKGSDCDTDSKGKAGGKSGKGSRGKAAKAQAHTKGSRPTAKGGKRQLAGDHSPPQKKNKKKAHKKKAAHKNKKKAHKKNKKKAATKTTTTTKSGKRQLKDDDLIYYK